METLIGAYEQFVQMSGIHQLATAGDETERIFWALVSRRGRHAILTGRAWEEHPMFPTPAGLLGLDVIVGYDASLPKEQHQRCLDSLFVSWGSGRHLVKDILASGKVVVEDGKLLVKPSQQT